jgi:hypothetical protein
MMQMVVTKDKQFPIGFRRLVAVVFTDDFFNTKARIILHNNNAEGRSKVASQKNHLSLMEFTAFPHL